MNTEGIITEGIIINDTNDTNEKVLSEAELGKMIAYMKSDISGTSSIAKTVADHCNDKELGSAILDVEIGLTLVLNGQDVAIVKRAIEALRAVCNTALPQQAEQAFQSILSRLASSYTAFQTVCSRLVAFQNVVKELLQTHQITTEAYTVPLNIACSCCQEPFIAGDYQCTCTTRIEEDGVGCCVERDLKLAGFDINNLCVPCFRRAHEWKEGDTGADEKEGEGESGQQKRERGGGDVEVDNVEDEDGNVGRKRIKV